MGEFIEKANQCDKLKTLIEQNEVERQELEAKLTHVINGSNLMQEKERAQYNNLQFQLETYCDKLTQAYKENEEQKMKIQELEQKVASAAEHEELLKQKNEESLALQQKQASLETRNLELERRIRELEKAAAKARGDTPKASQTPR